MLIVNSFWWWTNINCYNLWALYYLIIMLNAGLIDKYWKTLALPLPVQALEASLAWYSCSFFLQEVYYISIFFFAVRSFWSDLFCGEEIRKFRYCIYCLSQATFIGWCEGNLSTKSGCISSLNSVGLWF